MSYKSHAAPQCSTGNVNWSFVAGQTETLCLGPSGKNQVNWLHCLAQSSLSALSLCWLFEFKVSDTVEQVLKVFIKSEQKYYSVQILRNLKWEVFQRAVVTEKCVKDNITWNRITNNTIKILKCGYSTTLSSFTHLSRFVDIFHIWYFKFPELLLLICIFMYTIMESYRSIYSSTVLKYNFEVFYLSISIFPQLYTSNHYILEANIVVLLRYIYFMPLDILQNLHNNIKYNQ